MRYDVILYPVVIVKVCRVEAGSQTEAIELARDKTPFTDLFREKMNRPVSGLPGAVVTYTEFADGFDMCYLVDEEGDSEYARSNYYHDGPNGFVLGLPGDKEVQ